MGMRRATFVPEGLTQGDRRGTISDRPNLPPLGQRRETRLFGNMDSDGPSVLGNQVILLAMAPPTGDTISTHGRAASVFKVLFSVDVGTSGTSEHSVIFNKGQ